MRFFFILWVLGFLFLDRQDVEATQCYKSTFGWLRCSPCGSGTRCAFCNWCLGYCHNRDTSIQSRKNALDGQATTTTTDVEVPYRDSFIKMLKDVKDLIENDEISDIDVVELYKVTYFALKEDCELCNNDETIVKFRDRARNAHRHLKYIMKNEDITFNDVHNIFGRNLRKPLSEKFKKMALKKTRKVLETAGKISANLTAKVDASSPLALASFNLTTEAPSPRTSTPPTDQTSASSLTSPSPTTSQESGKHFLLFKGTS